MPSPRYQTQGLQEIYHEFGTFEIKIVLNPKFYSSAHDFKVDFIDSSNTKMPHEVQIWGRKINVKFQIGPTVSDGVCVLTMTRGIRQVGRLTAWIIKP